MNAAYLIPIFVIAVFLVAGVNLFQAHVKLRRILAEFRAQRSTPTFGVLMEVRLERLLQDGETGEQDLPDGTGEPGDAVVAGLYRESRRGAFGLGKGTWSHILLEQVYEAVAEKDEDNLADWLIQIAAVCVAWVEAIDRRKAARVKL